jgi:uncharacterized LabA/DUF88 family protein
MVKKPQNNYAFIDSQNLHRAICDQGWPLDYKKLRRYLTDKHSIAKTFYFIGYIPQYQSLYTKLRKEGYTLIFKQVVILPDKKVKGNVDVDLTLYVMAEYQNYDKALIVTGDGDYHCLITYLIENDKLLKLMIPNEKKFSLLFRSKEIKPYIVFINNLESKLKRIPRKVHKK